MKNFAVIENEMITNVIIAENLTQAKKFTGSECVETDGSFWIGWTRIDDAWVAPVLPEPEVVDDTQAL